MSKKEIVGLVIVAILAIASALIATSDGFDFKVKEGSGEVGISIEVN